MSFLRLSALSQRLRMTTTGNRMEVTIIVLARLTFRTQTPILETAFSYLRFWASLVAFFMQSTWFCFGRSAPLGL